LMAFDFQEFKGLLTYLIHKNPKSVIFFRQDSNSEIFKNRTLTPSLG